jgi:putative membrane protein
MNTPKIFVATLVAVSIITAITPKNIALAQPKPPTTTQQTFTAADRQFVTKAAQDNLAEIELGQLAVKQAKNDEIKKFAQRLVQDHSQINDELKQLVANRGITLPQNSGKENAKIKARLAKLSGDAFDKAYINHIVEDHKRAISLYERQAKQGNDPDLKNWAARILPTLQEHLQLANSIAERVRGGGGNR